MIHIEHGEHGTAVIFTGEHIHTVPYGYVVGELPPNYPVPARVLEDWWTDNLMDYLFVYGYISAFKWARYKWNS